MNYIRITKENIDKEHICCAMSGKQSVEKRNGCGNALMRDLFSIAARNAVNALTNGIPAENAWMPIEADGYLYINCSGIRGSMKGYGYSNDLLEACIRMPRRRKEKSICILCAEMKANC